MGVFYTRCFIIYLSLLKFFKGDVNIVLFLLSFFLNLNQHSWDK